MKKIKQLLLFICVIIFSFEIPLIAQQTGRLTRPLGIQNKNEKVPYLIKGKPELIKEAVSALGGNVKFTAGDIVSVNIPFNKVSEILKKDFVSRIEPEIYSNYPLSDSMRYFSNVDSAYSGFAPLSKKYNGNGVVVGFIDYGLDFNHADFKDSTGKTRIKYLWDHRDTITARIPSGYAYGTEWKASAIDSGLCTHDASLYGGHGTGVAGVAVGDGSDSAKYRGVAPMADIIAVVLESNSSFVDAIQYIYQRADSLGRPCVINASTGMGHGVLSGGTYGAHDGSDLTTQAINNLIKAKTGRAFVCAAGNDGSLTPFHLGYTVTSDTNFTWIKYNPATLFGPMVLFELWADTAKFKNVQFAIGADKVTPSYEYRGSTNFSTIMSRLNITVTDSLKSKSGNYLATFATWAEIIGDKYFMQIYTTKTDSSQYYFRFTTTGSGSFDIWSGNTSALAQTSDIVSSALPDSVTFPDILKYKAPDNYKSLLSGFTCSRSVLSVGCYINKSGTVGDIHSSSSKGYTLDERVKPEVIAPGGNIMSSNFGGGYKNNALTSFSSPVVSGAAALYLQKYPDATYEDVRQAIINSASQDVFTGTTPNKTWGYGKINAFRALVDWLPTLTAGSSLDTICQGDSVTLSTNGSSSYWWAKAATPTDTLAKNVSVKVAPVSTASYILTGVDTSGFSKKDTITITVNSLPTILVSPSNDTVCAGDTVSSSVSGAVSYSWKDSKGNTLGSSAVIDIVPDSSTYYYAVGTDTKGCKNNDSVWIVVNPLPVLISSDHVVCDEDIFDLTVSGAQFYGWVSSAGIPLGSNDTISVTADTTVNYYIVAGQDVNGCGSSDTVYVTVNLRPDIIAADANACEGDTVVLNASGGTAYIWQNVTGDTIDSDSTVVIWADTFAVYTVMVTNVYGCKNTKEVTVFVDTVPVVVALPVNDTICDGDVVLFTASGASSYIWYDAKANMMDTTAALNTVPDSSTYYYVIGTNNKGCKNTDTVWVTVNSLPVVNLGPDTGAYGQITLNAGNAGSQYVWSTGETTQTINTDTTGSYSVIVTDASGCSSSDTILFTLLEGIYEKRSLSKINIYPNPYKNKTIISYTLNVSANVDLKVYNILGEEITTLVNKFQIPGEYKVDFSAKSLGYASGVYILQMKINGQGSKTIRLVEGK